MSEQDPRDTSAAGVDRAAIKRALLTRKLRQKPSDASIPVASRESSLPLSSGQERLWVLDQLGAGSAYNVPAALRMQGDLDVQALRAALQEIVRRHESLRTVIAREGRRHVQTVQPPASFDVQIEDLRDRGGEAGQRALEIAEVEATKPFDLERGPVVR